MDAFPIQLLLRFFFTSSVLLEENIYSRVTYTSITSDRKLVVLSPENYRRKAILENTTEREMSEKVTEDITGTELRALPRQIS